MGREPIPGRNPTRGNLSTTIPCGKWSYPVLIPVSRGYPGARGRLLTCYSPVRRSAPHPKVRSSLDLHVLSTPPAFVLSQDQTLQSRSRNIGHAVEFSSCGRLRRPRRLFRGPVPGRYLIPVRRLLSPPARFSSGPLRGAHRCGVSVSRTPVIRARYVTSSLAFP